MPALPDRPDRPAPGPTSKGRVFARRLGSTVALWGLIALAVALASPWLFFLLIAGVVLLAMVEYFGLFEDAGRRRFRGAACAAGVLYIAALFAPILGFDAAWLREADGAAAVAALVALVVLGRLRRPLEGPRTLDEIAVAVFGFAYVALLSGFLVRILALPLADAEGQGSAYFYVLYLVAVTKFTDMGAYAVGSLIGRHKMVPHVSPGKTWQGFGGALLGAFVASYGCLALFGAKIPLLDPLHAGVLALALGLMAVLGDLAESILKRSLAAKDSGHGLPGIGGVLDLIDSVLFTAPVLFFYLLVLLP